MSFNQIPGEEVKVLVLKDGNVEPYEGEVDMYWSINGLENTCPYPGFLRYVVVRDHVRLGDYVEMRQIYVREQDRRLGVAHKLFKALEKITKKEKIRPIYVWAYFEEGHENDFARFLPTQGYEKLSHTDETFDWVKWV